MATQTTNTSAQAWHPDVTALPPTDVIPDALYILASNKGATVEGDAVAVRVPYITDDEAQFTDEGVEIPEADLPMSEAVAHTRKITELATFSREQWFQGGTKEQVVQSFKRSITKKANLAFVAQAAPVAPAVAPVAGVLNTPGIVAGGEVGGSLDELVDLIAELETNGATPSHIVLAPTSWAELRKLKTATGSNQSLLGAGASDAGKVLLDLPVIVSPAVPSLSGLVIDRNEIISAYGDIMVAVSDHAEFRSDSIVVRATWRVGHVIPRTNRVAKFTVADAA